MTIVTRPIEYEHDGVVLESVFAFDDATQGERPAVLVSHAWAGRSDFEVEKAKKMAEWGYAGFALDLYGKGVLGSSAEENQALMMPFIADRKLLLSRLMASVDIATAQPEADAANVAAIGFCFGGLCVLDIARSGAELNGVVSLHGLLGGPGETAEKIKTKTLVLHGWDDPMAPPADVETFAKEFTEAGADWQFHAFGGTMHAFTNPEANDPTMGTVYSQSADDRARRLVKDFLGEVFA